MHTCRFGNSAKLVGISMPLVDASASPSWLFEAESAPLKTSKELVRGKLSCSETWFCHLVQAMPMVDMASGLFPCNL